ncbi:hypothetical protein B2J93_674 [Marssonina coronariae]|uniref:Uncharacterized protein n=1 Tax=Diplocarpon coronariae TaxID=2795749 RepID=A0A218ZA87_9HELO|nr:hypothetical protein B2J93_674 [Marssonina coronariae]
MQANDAHNGASRKRSGQNPPPKYSRMQQSTKSAIKKFGPFLLTGLAAVAEHHWLKREESHHSKENSHAADREPPDERRPRSRSELRHLEDEIADLRRELKGKERQAHVEEERPPPASWSARPPPLARDAGSLHEQTTFSAPTYEEMPFAPTPPLSFPAPFSGVRSPAARGWESVEYPSSSGDDSDDERAMHQRRPSPRKRRHRRSSVPRRPDTAGNLLQAGKVAAVAGLVETLHVNDGKGDWIGPKGLRVGTTAAASFGATYLRDRDAEEYPMREVLADVGTGVLVSRLVYGRAVEKLNRARKRRWSHRY